MKSGMFRIYLFLKDETGDDYIGKIKFMCSPAEFSSFAGDLRDCEKKSRAMSQKWFIAFLGVMDYFNFSFSAFKSSRLSPCSPAVLSTQRFKESMAKEISSSFLLI